VSARLGASLLALTATLAFVALAGPVRAAEPVDFDAPNATGQLGRPLTFTERFRADQEPTRVELLTHLPTEETLFVQEASVVGNSGTYTATVVSEGELVPNTTFRYRFRVTTRSGTSLGPEATITYVDDRYEWRTLPGEIVRVHWYEGDESFARRALEIGDRAVADVSNLLGVTEEEPIDFFIYASNEGLYGALGPGTRENVGGQAHADIRTLFALIEPSEIDSDWVEVVVPHELTHLVFNTAVDNPYHFPPRWLNEGLAVYLSEGYSIGDRAQLESAARDGTLMPLDGLTGQFPTSRERFLLAYAESVSAVDFFIRTHGRDTLVKLVRSYSDGRSDDEAFTAATGVDVGAFEAAWLADVGAEKPRAYGPRRGPPGPLPPDWSAPSASPGPGSSAGPVERPEPTESVGPAPSLPGEGSGRLDPLVVLALAAIALTGAVAAGILTTRSPPPPRPGP
jgi:hypothetical protein